MKLYYDETDPEQVKFINDIMRFKYLLKVFKSDCKDYIKNYYEIEKNLETIKSIINPLDFDFMIEFYRTYLMRKYINHSTGEIRCNDSILMVLDSFAWGFKMNLSFKRELEFIQDKKIYKTIYFINKKNDLKIYYIYILYI